jgi:hypothetical protein
MKCFKLLIFICVFSSIRIEAQDKLGGNYNFETECYGVELDGSITVKAWGNGRNQSDAVEQAKKNAIRDIIFKGIHNGKLDCDRAPILIEPNAQEKHKEYFYNFFSDNGEYKNFITVKNLTVFGKIKKNKKKARESITQGLIIRVMSYNIKKKLIEDRILN